MFTSHPITSMSLQRILIPGRQFPTKCHAPLQTHKVPVGVAGRCAKPSPQRLWATRKDLLMHKVLITLGKFRHKEHVVRFRKRS